MKQHLSQNELVDRMYGLNENGDSHLQECQECSSRFQALELRRAEVVAASHGQNEAAVSNEFLLAQRRAIYSRLDQAPPGRLHWAPAALGVAFLLVTGVFLTRPHAAYIPVRPTATVTAVESSQEQLFSDLYSMEQSPEPLAAAPLHALFEGSEGDLKQ
jgi:hypothetical protein